IVSPWPAPGLDDTQLNKSGLLLELHRAQIADRRVPSFGIVEALDVVEYIRTAVGQRSGFHIGRSPSQIRDQALNRITTDSSDRTRAGISSKLLERFREAGRPERIRPSDADTPRQRALGTRSPAQNLD